MCTVDTCERAWARLLVKVYEIDPLVCPNCGSETKCSFAVAKLRQFYVAELQLSSVIQDPVGIRDIPAHLVKMGRASPGIHPALLNRPTLEVYLLGRPPEVYADRHRNRPRPCDSGAAVRIYLEIVRPPLPRQGSRLAARGPRLHSRGIRRGDHASCRLGRFPDSRELSLAGNRMAHRVGVGLALYYLVRIWLGDRRSQEQSPEARARFTRPEASPTSGRPVSLWCSRSSASASRRHR